MFKILAKAFSKWIRFAMLALLAASPSVPAFASTNNGIDTPSGSHDLPLAVEGNAVITLTDQPSNSATVDGTLTTTGNVGIGVAPSSTAPLDVGGGILGSSSSVKVGNSCSPEGMLGYDLVTVGAHQPVYCGGTQWAAFNNSSTSGLYLVACSGGCHNCGCTPYCNAGDTQLGPAAGFSAYEFGDYMILCQHP